MSAYRCRKCETGVLQPYIKESFDTENTEIFICSNPKCRHRTVIPSAVIVISQILSSFMGGLFAAYLFIQQLSVFVTIIQLRSDASITKPILLMSISMVFLVGLGYTLMVGLDGLSRRRLFQKAAENQVYHAHDDESSETH